MRELLMTGVEDVCVKFGMPFRECWDKYVDGEIYKKKELVDVIDYRASVEDLRVTFPEGGPGTVLNAMAIYTVCRYFNFQSAIETGVANGFYTTFLLSSIIENKGTMDSVEFLDVDGIAKVVPEQYKSYPGWKLYKGTDSLEFMKKSEMNYDVCCHDSLHTMSHMSRELMNFKRSNKDKIFIFFDDQDTELFWKRSLALALFNKKGYTMKCISGNESRLHGHLGGFIQYNKC
jgi:hypothetical protein